MQNGEIKAFLPRKHVQLCNKTVPVLNAENIADEQKQEYLSFLERSFINLFSTHQLPLASRLEKSGSPLQGEEGDKAAVVCDSLTLLMILSHSGQFQGQGNLSAPYKSMALKSMGTRDRQT